MWTMTDEDIAIYQVGCSNAFVPSYQLAFEVHTYQTQPTWLHLLPHHSQWSYNSQEQCKIK
jgi:hypothetical protein